MHAPTWHSLLCKISDDDNGEANTGEYSPNVGHPSEGNIIWGRRLGLGVNILQRGELVQRWGQQCIGRCICAT